MQVYIYVLVDPNTFEPRYVGVSDDPERRLKQHCYERINPAKWEWIKQLRKNGQMPILNVVARACNKTALKFEKQLIWDLYSSGMPLLNINYTGPDGSYVTLPQLGYKKGTFHDKG